MLNDSLVAPAKQVMVNVISVFSIRWQRNTKQVFFLLNRPRSDPSLPMLTTNRLIAFIWHQTLIEGLGFQRNF